MLLQKTPIRFDSYWIFLLVKKWLLISFQAGYCPKRNGVFVKKSGILNREISRVLATMGHYDFLVVADAGLPIPRDADCIDLSIDKNLPSVSQILSLLSTELEVEQIFFASEGQHLNKELISKIDKIFPQADMTFIDHLSIKDKVRTAKAVIRTGDFSPYSNTILSCGVSFSTYEQRITGK